MIHWRGDMPRGTAGTEGVVEVAEVAEAGVHLVRSVCTVMLVENWGWGSD